MELWCKSNRWINLVVIFLIFVFERLVNIFFNKNGRVDVRIFFRWRKIILFSELYIFLFLKK